jgi:alcohol dehydrogenase
VNGGTGTLGIGAVLLSLAMGASRVFATGRDSDRLKRLQALAPERIVSIAVSEGSIAAQVLAMTDGVGADVMIEALAPYAPAATVIDAFNGLRRGGRAVNVGGVFDVLPIEPVKLMVQQKSLMGSLWFSTSEAQDMARMAEAGTLRLDVFDNELFPLERINDALDATETRSGGFTNIVVKHR